MKLRPAAGIAIALASLPEQAHAHGANAGIGDFAGGVIHPGLVPGHLLMLVGLGLWLGQQDLRRTGGPVLAFAIALAAGLAASPLVPPGPVAGGLLLLVALAAGLLVAAARSLPIGIATGLWGVAALVLGLDSAPDAGAAGHPAVALAGTWLGAQVIMLDVFGVASLASRAWVKIGLRVLGSWTAASALMVLALAVA